MIPHNGVYVHLYIGNAENSVADISYIADHLFAIHHI